MIAGLTLENAAARGPLLLLGRRVVPQGLHGQILNRATAWNQYQQGMCPQHCDRA